jgi:hypothetical protein
MEEDEPETETQAERRKTLTAVQLVVGDDVMQDDLLEEGGRTAARAGGLTDEGMDEALGAIDRAAREDDEVDVQEDEDEDDDDDEDDSAEESEEENDAALEPYSRAAEHNVLAIADEPAGVAIKRAMKLGASGIARRVGDAVRAIPAGGGETSYPGKIVAVAAAGDEYDVQFDDEQEVDEGLPTHDIFTATQGRRHRDGRSAAQQKQDRSDTDSFMEKRGGLSRGTQVALSSSARPAWGSCACAC